MKRRELLAHFCLGFATYGAREPRTNTGLAADSNGVPIARRLTREIPVELDALREGGSHSIWVNPGTGRKEAVPRHNEVKRHLARSICRNLSIEVPKGT